MRRGNCSENDALSNYAPKESPSLSFRTGTAQTASEYPHALIGEGGTIGTNRRVVMRHYTAAGTFTDNTIMDANGVFLPVFSTKTDLAKTAVSYTLASNITRVSGGIYEDSTAVYIGISIKTSAQIGVASATVITGLPLPKAGSAVPISVAQYGSTNPMSGSVTSNGALNIRPSVAVPANGEIYLSGVYPKS